MLNNYLPRLTSALRESPDDLGAVFAAAAEPYEADIGYRLLTVSAVNTGETPSTTRVWSSRPDIFPPGDDKPLEDGEWTRTVMQEQRPFICPDAAALRDQFFDHAGITAADCSSGVNLPVVVRRQVIGVVNLFHESQWFTPERVAAASGYLALMVAPLLLRKPM